MNRALFSGVAGLKTHQSKMDVIGNNIANVNTFGFKTQRAVFSDVFYQTMTSASGGSASRGGVNPSVIGYGSTLSGIQTNMSQSSMQNTGFTTDMAVAGDGFFQVQDAAGNIFYTKAGMLDVDANGYMVDMNGNFVLGATQADGKPNTQKINLVNSLGSVDAAAGKGKMTINGIELAIEASGANKDGNVAMSFASSTSLPAGEIAKAVISETGAIAITFNATASFADVASVNTAINNAVTEAYGGTHPGGTFSLSATKDGAPITTFMNNATPPVATPLTGAELAGANFGTKNGSITTGALTPGTPPTGLSGITISEVRSGFSANVATAIAASPVALGVNAAVPPAVANKTITMTIDGKTYTGTINEGTAAGTVLMKNTAAGADANDAFVMAHPGYDNLGTAVATDNVVLTAAVASKPSRDLGLSSASMGLTGGTEGGTVSLDQLTNIGIGSDGKIAITHESKGNMIIGKISLANFANPAGLQQTGTNYFATTANSGPAVLCNAGESGTGNLKSSALEMSNVDLSSEMADMITTQRGFQANSRIITVSDTMLEELINLKR